MSFLVDTNVISEPRRPRPDTKVVSWFNRTDPSEIHVSVLTLGELARGASRALQRDAAAGLRLQRWLDEVQADFSDRVLDIDRRVATLWGELTSARTMPVIDSLLAATALTHGMTLVTRNVRDVADTGVKVINPWDD